MSSLNLEDTQIESSLTTTTSFNIPNHSAVSRDSRKSQIPPEPKPKPPQEILRGHPYYYKVHDNQRFFMEVSGIISSWKPASEVWFLKWGHLLMGAASTASASYINWHFRETLVLLNYSRISSYAAMFLVPGVMASAMHYWLVTAPLVTEKNKCGICLQLRAMSLQGMCSILYPFVLVPLCCYPVAKRLKSPNLPNLKLTNPYPVLNFTREMLRPIKGNIWMIAGAQVLLGAIVTYKEQVTYFETVLPKLRNMKNVFSNWYPRPEKQ